MKEEDIKQLSVFLEHFQKETDRGTALIGYDFGIKIRKIT